MNYCYLYLFYNNISSVCMFFFPLWLLLIPSYTSFEYLPILSNGWWKNAKQGEMKSEMSRDERKKKMAMRKLSEWTNVEWKKTNIKVGGALSRGIASRWQQRKVTLHHLQFLIRKTENQHTFFPCSFSLRISLALSLSSSRCSFATLLVTRYR